MCAIKLNENSNHNTDLSGTGQRGGKMVGLLYLEYIHRYTKNFLKSWTNTEFRNSEPHLSQRAFNPQKNGLVQGST